VAPLAHLAACAVVLTYSLSRSTGRAGFEHFPDKVTVVVESYLVLTGIHLAAEKCLVIGDRGELSHVGVMTQLTRQFVTDADLVEQSSGGCPHLIVVDLGPAIHGCEDVMTTWYMNVRGTGHLKIIGSIKGIVRFPTIGKLIVTDHSAGCCLPVTAKGDVLRSIIKIDSGIGNTVDVISGMTIVAKCGRTDEVIWTNRC